MPAGAKARLGLYVGSHHQGWGSHHVVARQAGPSSISSPRERVKETERKRLTGALQQCTSTVTGEPGGKKGGAGISWVLSCTAGKVKCFENHLFFGESVSTVAARAGKGGKISWLVCTDSGCEAWHCSGSAN